MTAPTSSHHDEVEATASRPLWWTWVLAAHCVVVGGLWWAWPTLTGADETPPTVVILTPAMAESADRFTGALRERGHRAQVVVADGGWCATVEAGSTVEGSRHVVIADPEPGCDPWISGLDGHWAWISPSGVAAGAPASVALIDVSWTLGDGGTLRTSCEWWDVCEADGQVTLRSEPGVLTAAGIDRVARVVAAWR